LSSQPPIDLARAKAIAELSLEEIVPARVTGLVMDEHTRELDFGWVFFYQAREYLETGDTEKMMVGNAPLIVDRTGRAFVTGTALSIEQYIDEYRKGRLQELS
jgi:hypothetical protein